MERRTGTTAKPDVMEFDPGVPGRVNQSGSRPRHSSVAGAGDLKEVPPVVIITGPPGSGKSTQARGLVERFGFADFDTGGALRSLRDEPSPLGEWVRQSYASGRLAPPPLVTELVVREVQNSLRRGRGMVLHGSPRTIREAEALLPVIARPERKGRTLFLLLSTPKPETVRRITERWTCEGCGHMVSSPTPVETCPTCGGACGKRVDDTPEKMEQRWEEYAFRTEPTAAFLRRRLPTVEIDGFRPIPEVTAEVQRRVAEFYALRVT